MTLWVRLAIIYIEGSDTIEKLYFHRQESKYAKCIEVYQYHERKKQKDGLN